MILMYHKVDLTTPTMWWVSVDAFNKQLAALKAYDVVYLDSYDPTNPRHVVITFDGVYQNVLTRAAPILQKWGYPFEVFVIGDCIGLDNAFDLEIEPRTPFASIEELEKIVKAGGRIQWHTRTHTKLESLSKEALDLELTPSDTLKSIFPSPHLDWFAYPHGEHDSRIVDAVKKKFKGALSCIAGSNEDRFQLNRVTVTEDSSFFKSKVSVIIPNYNYRPFLREAVASVRNQTIAPDEVLIIDDASTDGSHQLLSEFEEFAKVVVNEKNLGIVENFKKAVSLTSGDYVAFLGADNRMRSDYVEKCRAALDSSPKAAVAYTDMAIFGQRGGILAQQVGALQCGESIGERSPVFFWNFPDPTPDTLKNFKTKNFIHGSSMYRRSDYEAVGGYSSGKGPEDHNLFFRMLANDREAFHVKAPLIEYRQHSSTQANTMLSLETEIRALLKRGKSLENQIAHREEDISRLKNEVSRLEEKCRFTDPTTGEVITIDNEALAVLIENNEARGQRILALEKKIRNADGEFEALSSKLHKLVSSLELEVADLRRRQQEVRSPQKRKHVERQKTLIQEWRRANQARGPLKKIFSWAGSLFEKARFRKELGIISSSGLFDKAFYALESGQSLEQDTESLIIHYLYYGVSNDFSPHPLFDPHLYLSANPDVGRSGVDPFTHFLLSGAREGRPFHALFDTAYYRSQCKGEADDINPLIHYLKSPIDKRKNPHPLFDDLAYSQALDQVNIQGEIPLLHFMRHNGQSGIDPHPFFDTQYYLDHNLDVKSAGINPLIHFFYKGGIELRNPHILFDTAYYVRSNTSVDFSKVNPLVHYVTSGESLNRNPSPIFNVQEYRAQIKNEENVTSPLKHFIEKGRWNDAKPNSLFDPTFYKKQNLPILERYRNNSFLHYLEHGERAGYKISNLFDTDYYRKRHVDLKDRDRGLLAHYLEYGVFEGRFTTPFFAPSIHLLCADQYLQKPLTIKKLLIEKPKKLSIFCIYGPGNVSFISSMTIPILQELGKKLQIELHLLNYSAPESLFKNFSSDTFRLLDWSNSERHKHLGFGEGMNFLFRKVSPDQAFLIMNPDSYPMTGCIETMLLSIIESGSGIVEARQWPHEHPKEFDKKSGDTPWASGAFSLISSEAFQKVGGFDQSFFLYTEDVDLSWKFWMEGFRVLHEHKALCCHLTGLLSYRNDRFYHENLFSNQNFISIARKYFGDKGEELAKKILCNAPFPEKIRDEIILGAERQRRSFTPLDRKLPSQIKILGLNVYHQFQAKTGELE